MNVCNKLESNGANDESELISIESMDEEHLNVDENLPISEIIESKPKS